MMTEISENRQFWPPNVCLTPLLRKPHEYPHEPYTAWQQDPWATMLRLIVRVCLLSDFRGERRKTHRYCSRVRYGRSKSSKVVDFGSNWKRMYDFLLVINSNRGPISHSFWDMATYWLKIADFLYPVLFNALDRSDPFRIFGKALHLLKLEFFAEPQWRFRDPSLGCFHTTAGYDRRTDGYLCDS